jgi:3'-phosphoadenosine 5'-phosphosulfate sulfotransferase (PAPS reductase)/FAD synthetase
VINFVLAKFVGIDGLLSCTFTHITSCRTLNNWCRAGRRTLFNSVSLCHSYQFDTPCPAHTMGAAPQGVPDFAAALSTGVAPSGAALSPGLARVLCDSLDILAEAVRRYGAAHIATAFNGGKDATVILHLTRAAIATASEEAEQAVRCMYLVEETAFPEVDAFVRATVSACPEVSAVEQGGGFKAGIQAFVEERGVVAFVMGTRSSDPYANDLCSFAPSSAGWPHFIRVSPILEWEYKHVWEFLRVFEIPYCALYDVGYTSIGNICNTRPNPALADPDLPGCFRPAYSLRNGDKERAGRTSSSSA